MARFRNPHLLNARRGLWDFILWRFGCYPDPIGCQSPPDGFVYPAEISSFSEKDPYALWVGHSSYLISVGGITLLTDPVWSPYCSPIPIEALRRRIDPAIALSDLPAIDFVLISHNHYDHLDAKTVSALHLLHPQIHWIVPKKLSPWFFRRGIENVYELDWWESRNLFNLGITAVPSQHFSGRTLWDKNKTGWNGYVVEVQGKSFYFAGDTGYNKFDFKEIGDLWKGFDLSLIPIGAYAPRQFMQPVHINPVEAVQIHQDVRSCFSLGMHWNTFRLSEEPFHSPPYALYVAMKDKNLPFSSFLPINPGIYVNW